MNRLLIAGSCLLLAGCAQIETTLHDRAARANASQANAHQNPEPQPTCASYIVHQTDGSAKEMTACFSGDGRGRIIWRGDAGKTKIVLNYIRGTQISLPPTAEAEITVSLDPAMVPPFYDSRGAIAYGAECTGSGVLKGHEYHSWIKQLPDREIEVWTDDDGVFPCYFRSRHSGDGATTSWAMQSAWVDQTLKDKEGFFEATTVPTTRAAKQ